LNGNTDSAAYKLQGKTLPGGWQVLGIVNRPQGGTGGHFSVGYLVENGDGRKGFLKALDYSAAFQSKLRPISVELQELTESINFEKYVLARCRDRRLDRVVISIADGTLVDQQAGTNTVEYLIFELADCDARAQMAIISNLDIEWRLKSLHDIATGLQQLHRNDIRHQDLKPSNVLVFERMLSKLADFGRSACDGQNPPHSCHPFPGDYTYAPPDVLYGYMLTDAKMRQLSFDAYLLGSMVFFFFTGQGATTLLLNEMPPVYADWRHFNGDVDDVKLHLRDAFVRVAMKFPTTMPTKCRTQLLETVLQVCDPDPARRGHPREKRGTLQQFSLERYVTIFDLLLMRARLGLLV